MRSTIVTVLLLFTVVTSQDNKIVVNNPNLVNCINSITKDSCVIDIANIIDIASNAWTQIQYVYNNDVIMVVDAYFKPITYTYALKDTVHTCSTYRSLVGIVIDYYNNICQSTKYLNCGAGYNYASPQFLNTPGPVMCNKIHVGNGLLPAYKDMAIAVKVNAMCVNYSTIRVPSSGTEVKDVEIYYQITGNNRVGPLLGNSDNAGMKFSVANTKDYVLNNVVNTGFAFLYDAKNAFMNKVYIVGAGLYSSFNPPYATYPRAGITGQLGEVFANAREDLYKSGCNSYFTADDNRSGNSTTLYKLDFYMDGTQQQGITSQNYNVTVPLDALNQTIANNSLLLPLSSFNNGASIGGYTVIDEYNIKFTPNRQISTKMTIGRIGGVAFDVNYIVVCPVVRSAAVLSGCYNCNTTAKVTFEVRSTCTSGFASLGIKTLDNITLHTTVLSIGTEWSNATIEVMSQVNEFDHTTLYLFGQNMRCKNDQMCTTYNATISQFSNYLSLDTRNTTIDDAGNLVPKNDTDIVSNVPSHNLESKYVVAIVIGSTVGLIAAALATYKVLSLTAYKKLA